MIASVFVLFFLLIVFVFGICGTVLWIWALVDCVKNEPETGNERLIWILLVALLHWVGALIYLLVRRPQRIQQLGH